MPFEPRRLEMGFCWGRRGVRHTPELDSPSLGNVHGDDAGRTDELHPFSVGELHILPTGGIDRKHGRHHDKVHDWQDRDHPKSSNQSARDDQPCARCDARNHTRSTEQVPSASPPELIAVAPCRELGAQW